MKNKFENVRDFWLENSSNEVYNLLDKNHFLSDPQGLGFSRSYTSTRLGNETELKSSEASMPSISGTLVFNYPTLANTYSAYKTFVQFIKKKPLQLHYRTPDTFDDVYIECEVSSLEKGEISNGLLYCAIKFFATSFWKTSTIHELSVSSSLVGEGKEYPYEYPYSYSGNSLSNIVITNNGTMDVGFIYQINESVNNPSLSLYQNNEKYGEIKLTGTFTKMIINTTDTDQQIYLESNGSVLANPTSYFDLSSSGQYDTPFPKLKVGENKLAFTSGTTFSGSVNIKWQDNFISN